MAGRDTFEEAVRACVGSRAAADRSADAASAPAAAALIGASTDGRSEQQIERVLDRIELTDAIRRELAEALARLCPNGELSRSAPRPAMRTARSIRSPVSSTACSCRVRRGRRSACARSGGPDSASASWRIAASTAWRRSRGRRCSCSAWWTRAAGVAFGADPVSGRRGDRRRQRRLGPRQRPRLRRRRRRHVPRRPRAAPSSTARSPTSRPPIAPRRHRVGRPGRAGRCGDGEAARADRRPGARGRRAGAARPAAFGRPQDIEWAIEAGRLYLLQSRPITSLAAPWPIPTASLNIWDNSNIAESYGGITTPLTFSFARDDLRGRLSPVLPHHARARRGHRRATTTSSRNMLGLVRGRIYYNLLELVSRCSPCCRASRQPRVHGTDDGREGGAARRRSPRRSTQAIDPVRGRIAGRAAPRGHAWSAWSVNYATLDRRDARVLRAGSKPRSAAPDPPLDDRARPTSSRRTIASCEQQLLLTWDAPLVNDFFAMIFYGLLAQAGARSGAATSRDAAERPRRRRRRHDQRRAGDARAAPRPAGRRGSDPARALLTGSLPRHHRRRSTPRPRSAREYAAYLDKFGERTVNELKLESATFHDDPLPLLRAIGNLSRQASPIASAAAAPSTHGATLRLEAQARVRTALAWHPIRRVVFRWVLKHAQARVRDRENLRLERTRLFGRIRRIMRELGRRFQDLGMLDDAHDIFYLELDEVLALVEGRSTCTNVRALAAIRREEFAGYESNASLEPDDRFETRGIVYHANNFRHIDPPRDASDRRDVGERRATGDARANDHGNRSDSSAVNDAGDARTGAASDERRGLGCCPGVVRGHVRVVRDPRDVTLDRPDHSRRGAHRSRLDPDLPVRARPARRARQPPLACGHRRARARHSRGGVAAWPDPLVTRRRLGRDRRQHRRRPPRRRRPGVQSEAAARADFSEIRYAQVWEDADILLDALDVRPAMCVCRSPRRATTPSPY